MRNSFLFLRRSIPSSHLPTTSTVRTESTPGNWLDGVGGSAHGSVHRHSAVITESSLPVPQQARVDTQHMFIVRVGKGFVRKVYSLIKQGLRLIFSHRAIVGQ